MKKVDDKNIKNILKSKDAYQIKTTSDDIFNKFILEENKKPQKVSNKKVILWSSLSTCLATCAVVGIIVGINFAKPQPSTKKPIVVDNPISKINTEFGIFVAFNNQNQNVQNKILRKNNLVSDAQFKTAMDKFDEVSNGIGTIFNRDDIKILTYQYGKEFNGQEYEYYSDYIKNEQVISRMYFHNKTSNFVKGILDNNNDGTADYEVISYIDEEFDEVEKYSKYSSLTKKEIFVIEEENEFEGSKTENSYSYYYYKDEESLEDEKYFYGFQYEIEDDTIQMTYFDQDFIEYSYKDIKEINDNKIEFKYEYEDDLHDIEVKSKASLTYESDAHLYQDLNNSELIYRKAL